MGAPQALKRPRRCLVAEFPTGTDVALQAVGIAANWDDALPPRAGCDYFSDPAKEVCHVIAERSRWAVVTFGGAQADTVYIQVELYEPRGVVPLKTLRTRSFALG